MTAVASGFEYLEWRARDKDFPCLFAKALVRSLGAQAVVFEECSEDDPASLAALIDAKISAARKVDTVKVVALHVPSWTQESMAETFVALGQTKGWTLKTKGEIDYGGQVGLPVGLHLELRPATANDLGVETVPMVLGPFPQLPASRRCEAPIFELMIDADAAGNKVKDGVIRTDFLALPTPLLTKKQFKRQRKAVQDNVVRVNGSRDDPRAQADVTATFDVAFATILNR